MPTVMPLMDTSKNNNIVESLFDESSGYDEETGVRFASGLTAEERKLATILFRLFNELWGLLIVIGDPGAGKDVFGNFLSYNIKRFFPWKKILRDEKPRKLFGEYAGPFNEAVLKGDLDNMTAVAKGLNKTETGASYEKSADKWVTEKGEVMLKNGLLYLTEFWRYCYNREAHNPMNKTMGAIHKVKRHLDLLVVGTVQLETELDKKTCLPWVDWVVTCTKSAKNPTGFVFYVQRVKYDRRSDLLVRLPYKPFPIVLDAGSPRTYMGDGKIVIKRESYKHVNEEERIILTLLRAGVDTYEKIVETIDEHGDMSKLEILTTLKALKFKKSKRAIDYPCYFGLYNSKSAPQIATTLKVAE